MLNTHLRSTSCLCAAQENYSIVFIKVLQSIPKLKTADCVSLHCPPRICIPTLLGKIFNREIRLQLVSLTISGRARKRKFFVVFNGSRISLVFVIPFPKGLMRVLKLTMPIMIRNVKEKTKMET